MNENSKISTLKGIGEKTQALFEKAGIRTIGDLLRYYPRGYDVYDEPVPVGEAEEGRTVTVTGAIFGRVQLGGSKKMQVTTLYVKDLTGTLKVIWFRMPFLKNTLSRGGIITLRGRVVRKRDGLVMEHPEIFYPSAKYEEKRNTLQPVYPLTSGLTNNAVKKAVMQAMQYLDLRQEFLPEDIRMKYHLAEYNYAVRGVHFPETKEEFYHARERLVFEEFLIFILSLKNLKVREDKAANGFVFAERPEIDQLLASLPYELTNAQQKVWGEIKRDMSGPNVMSRLVQGDVGLGQDNRCTAGPDVCRAEWFPGGYDGAYGGAGKAALRKYYLHVQTIPHPIACRAADRLNDCKREAGGLRKNSLRRVGHHRRNPRADPGEGGIP